MVEMKMKGSSVKITLTFHDLLKKLGYVRNENHDKALEAGLVELSSLGDLSGTHDILAVYGDNGLTMGSNSEKIEYGEFRPVRMYSDVDKIYVLLKSDAGKTIAAIYSDRL